MALDTKTIESVVRLYYREIYRYCFSRLMNPHSAEDVVQSVFLLLQEKSGELTAEHLRAWLYSVAQKKILEERRDEMRRNRCIAYDMDRVAADPAFTWEIAEEEEISDGEIESIKTRILQRLTPEEQRLFEAVYEKRVRRKEAAEQFGISENALNVRVHRMKTHIKSLMRSVMMILVFLYVKCR